LNGSWQLSERIFESGKPYSIKLKVTFEYVIINIHEDEMTISEGGSKYVLSKNFDMN